MVFSSADVKSAKHQKGSTIGGTRHNKKVLTKSNVENKRHSLCKVKLNLHVPTPMPDGFLISSLWEMRKIKMEKSSSLVSGLKTSDTVEGKVEMLQ